MKLLKTALAFAALAISSAALGGDSDAPVDTSAFKETIKLACVGDSITAGSGTSNDNAYPAQLQRMLGDKWKIGNFGSGGRTLMNKGDNPYQTVGKLKEALAFKPDVVVIMLGTNDTKPQNWKFKDQFTADYKDLIGKFGALDTKPRVFVVRPCPVFGKGNFGITEQNLLEEIPLIDAVAKELSLGVIDVHEAMKDKESLIPDRVHPNNEGAALLAKTVFAKLAGKAYEGPSTINEPGKKTPASGPAK